MSKKATIIQPIGKGKSFNEVMELISKVKVKDLDYKKKKEGRKSKRDKE